MTIQTSVDIIKNRSATELYNNALKVKVIIGKELINN